MIKLCTNEKEDHVYQECDGQHVHELALCEQNRIVLYPGRLYVFKVIEGCKSCEKANVYKIGD